MTQETKKYYWIKLKTDFFNQETMDFLLSQKNGCEYVVLYQMLCLNTANTNGAMISRVGEVIAPYDINKIVRDTKYFDFDTVAVALELFKKLGLIYVEENGYLKISDLERMIGSESANREAIKKREQRLRKKLGTQEGTNCPTEYRDKSIDNNIYNIYAQIPQKTDVFEGMFNTFYENYPRKVNKKDTLKWFIKKKPSEELFKTIMDKLEEYKKVWKDKQFIPYPTTWLNEERWNDELDVESSEDKSERKVTQIGNNTFTF